MGGVGGQSHAPAALSQPVPIKQEAGWDPGPGWTGAENLAATWIRSSDRPALIESLYRLRYSGRIILNRANLLEIVYIRCRHLYHLCWHIVYINV